MNCKLYDYVTESVESIRVGRERTKPSTTIHMTDEGEEWKKEKRNDSFLHSKNFVLCNFKVKLSDLVKKSTVWYSNLHAILAVGCCKLAFAKSSLGNNFKIIILNKKKNFTIFLKNLKNDTFFWVLCCCFCSIDETLPKQVFLYRKYWTLGFFLFLLLVFCCWWFSDVGIQNRFFLCLPTI